MAWNKDDITVANLLSTIATRLTANGWTLTDRAEDQVWHSTNAQGATQYIQITNKQGNNSAASSAANRYLQFQAWRSWNTGTHAGVDGSSTSYMRIYYSNVDVPDSTALTLYSSVTANRLILVIAGTSGFRNWAYFGGLTTDLAGTADSSSIVLTTSYGQTKTAYADTPDHVYALSNPLWSGSWGNVSPVLPGIPESYDENNGVALKRLTSVMVANKPNILLLWPIYLVCNVQTQEPTAGPILLGQLDGLYLWPCGSGQSGSFDTATLDGTTYLLFTPGGVSGNGGNTGHPITGNYFQGLAIPEV